MNTPGGNFASGAVWHTTVFKVSAFHFFGPKTDQRDYLFKNPKLNPNSHYRYKTMVFVTHTSVLLP